MKYSTGHLGSQQAPPNSCLWAGFAVSLYVISLPEPDLFTRRPRFSQPCRAIRASGQESPQPYGMLGFPAFPRPSLEFFPGFFPAGYGLRYGFQGRNRRPIRVSRQVSQARYVPLGRLIRASGQGHTGFRAGMYGCLGRNVRASGQEIRRKSLWTKEFFWGNY